MYVCPRCNGNLITKSVEAVEIEVCDGCGGTWLDANELKVLAETSVTNTVSDKAQGANEASSSQQNADMQCPKCSNRDLIAFIYACDSGIELDKCPQCNGLWFDNNELKQITSLMSKNDNSQLSDIIKTRRDSEGVLAKHSGELKCIGKFLMKYLGYGRYFRG